MKLCMDCFPTKYLPKIKRVRQTNGEGSSASRCELSFHFRVSLKFPIEVIQFAALLHCSNNLKCLKATKKMENRKKNHHLFVAKTITKSAKTNSFWNFARTNKKQPVNLRIERKPKIGTNCWLDSDFFPLRLGWIYLIANMRKPTKNQEISVIHWDCECFLAARRTQCGEA